MPILLMALLALLVFGVIGILLAAAVVVENSKRARIARGNAAHSVISDATPPFHPKP